MNLELTVQDGSMGEEDGKPEFYPELLDENVTVAKLHIGPEHMRKIQSLKPNVKVTITLRGMVQSFEQAAGAGPKGTTGELCLIATELSSSRGSEFDELLDE